MIGTHEVTAAGVDISCLLDDLDITHGRANVAAQPEASAATLNITVGPGAPLPPEVDIGAELTVETVVGGVTSRRFTGRITDISIGWDDAGPETPDRGVGQIVAVSVLADYARRVVGTEPFPQELDGARVARVFALAGLVLDPLTSDPGIVQVIPRDVDARSALEVTHGTANSAGGLVWETREGEVRYADAEHRRGADVELNLDACDILVTPTWSRTLAGLVNGITMGYGVPPAEGGGEAPTYRATNEESRAKWGRYGYSVTTELAEWVDAFAASSLILAQNAGPVWMLNALPVDVAGLTVAETHALLALDVHSLLRVTGLPYTGSAPTSLAAWVEGWTEHLSFGVHELELTVSDYCRTVPGPRWNDLPTATTWNTVTGTWDEWACVGGPVANEGRWDDVPASTRWDQVAPDLAWDEAVAV